MMNLAVAIQIYKTPLQSKGFYLEELYIEVGITKLLAESKSTSVIHKEIGR